jgi:hypothetical protein
MSTNLPMIFILDIDNTLIGKSNEIIKYNDFLTYIKNSCNRNKIEKKDDICIKKWNYKITDDFYRPYLTEFFSGIRDLSKNTEFFVFSLGTFNYVKDMVELIEDKMNGITFNKPYFSRENSFITDKYSYVKDINAYESVIIDKLKHKYPNISKNSKKIFEERTIIIDDIDIWDDDFRHIKIKPYNFYPIIEYDLHLLEFIYKNDHLYNYVLNSEILTIERGNSFQDFLMNYHIYMTNLYNTHNKTNNDELKDNTFKVILDSLKRRMRMKNIKITKEYIINLNKKLLLI